MIPPSFCNYNLDYQQRLGFLKLMVEVCDGVRGGPDQFKNRLRHLYRSTSPGRALLSSRFDPKSLLERDEIPSWQPGISKERLDRLVLWGEMTGLVVNGRLSEWARILRLITGPTVFAPEVNPFLLSVQERAFFVHLLFYHDQVLVELVRLLKRHPANARLGVWDACLDTTEAIGCFFDGLQESGSGFERAKLKHILRDLLSRMALQFGLQERGALLSKDQRGLALSNLRQSKPLKRRAHLAEYHAVCRFEQLTDLGLLIKDPPNIDPNERSRESRRLWEWYVPANLIEAATLLPDSQGNLENFLSNDWISFCGRSMNLDLKPLDSFADQREIARLLDQTLPSSRRQLGPVQIHSWATLTCLAALNQRRRLEIGTILLLFDAMREDPDGNSLVRQGGGGSFLTRTASIAKQGISSFFSEHTIKPGVSPNDRT